MNDVWVVEFNTIDGRWHVDELQRSTQSNLKAFFKELHNPWIVVGSASTFEDASILCEILQGIIKLQ